MYAWIGHSRAFTTAPSNILQHWHALTNAQQSSSIFGHQKCSCASANVLCWPWCLASQCTPLRAAHQCAEGTTKANNPSVLPLGVMFTYSIPFFMVKLFLTQNSALPSSESECSPMHVLSKVSLFWRGTSFLVLIHLQQVANSTSSPCASSQLVMCMGANLRAWTCWFFIQASCSTLKGQLMRTSPLSVVLVTAPSRSDHTVSLSCLTGTRLSAFVSCSIIWSFLIFQCEFIGCKCSYPTVSCHIQIWCCQHICQWIVVCTYCERGVARYSLKCSVTLHFNARNSSLELW